MAFHAQARLSRRGLLSGAAAAAAACLPLPVLATSTAIYTPHELRQAYRREVRRRLEVPPEEVRVYGGVSELQLFSTNQELLAPQYLLVVDCNAHVQAAFLFWRLVAGSYELVGASPVSTGRDPPGAVDAVRGLLEEVAAADGACARSAAQTCRSSELRVYDFGWPRGHARPVRRDLRLQVRGADGAAAQRLGSPCAEDCILLPASLVAFLDEYGVLDAGSGRPQRHVLPFRGRHLLVVDSERDERPGWSPPPRA